jgi:hypothetical protein
LAAFHFGLLSLKPAPLFGNLPFLAFFISRCHEFSGKILSLFCKFSGLALLFSGVFRYIGLDF